MNEDHSQHLTSSSSQRDTIKPEHYPILFKNWRTVFETYLGFIREIQESEPEKELINKHDVNETLKDQREFYNTHLSRLWTQIELLHHKQVNVPTYDRYMAYYRTLNGALQENWWSAQKYRDDFNQLANAQSSPHKTFRFHTKDVQQNKELPLKIIRLYNANLAWQYLDISVPEPPPLHDYRNAYLDAAADCWRIYNEAINTIEKQFLSGEIIDIEKEKIIFRAQLESAFMLTEATPLAPQKLSIRAF